jgi:hypothetical protein
MQAVASSVEQWGVFETQFSAPGYVSFSLGNRTLTVESFADGPGIFRVRFMPDAIGPWTFEGDGFSGSFEVTSPTSHGPIRVQGTTGFVYADGTPHRSIGTTCYNWVNQPDERVALTLASLRDLSFNKLRMGIFPKNYEYNRDEPPTLPFVNGEINPLHFQRFDRAISALAEIGVEADLILFHPYDFGRWGFDTMSPEADDAYVRYCVARFGAYRNVWWSLANEFDLFKAKTDTDWDRMLRLVDTLDPYRHLRSIHNAERFFDHSHPSVTHASVQTNNLQKVAEWNATYRKPIVIDECGYEGDVEHSWGNLTAEELVRRFWEGVCRGGHVGHSETYWAPDEVMWWGRGGKLKGQSASRIAFMKDILDAAPGPFVPFPEYFAWDRAYACAGVKGQYYLAYFGGYRPRFRSFSLPEGRFKVDVIDTWKMTISRVAESAEGSVRVELPARPYMAVRMEKV